MATTHYIVIAVAFLTVAAMSCLAIKGAPNPWILVITGAGAVFSIGMIIYKKRKGSLS
jgi:hypothetical protein